MTEKGVKGPKTKAAILFVNSSICLGGKTKLNTFICFAFFFPNENGESFIAPAIQAVCMLCFLHELFPLIYYSVYHVPLAMFA